MSEILSDLLLLVFVFGYCLFLTEVLELLVALLFGVRNKKDLGLVALANALTNPWLVFIVLLFLENRLTYTIGLPVLEIAAVAVEAYIYKKYSAAIRHPVIMSITANLVSFFIGLLISTALLVVAILASKG